MKIIKILGRSFNLGFIKRLTKTVHDLPITEKVVFYIAITVLVISSLILLMNVNNNLQTKIPTHGGSLSEGIVGTPRFINPLLSISNADRDLTTLVYSGLLRPSNTGGYVNDLAKSYEVSPDGTIYTFKIKNDLKFQDGKPLTTKDIDFTIKMAQDSTLRSPKRVNWESVTVHVLSENEIQFVLPEPFSPFLDNLTIGILPEHIWGNITSEQFQFSKFNTEPIGSGPYKVGRIKYDPGGLPVYYELSPFKDYALGRAYIDKLVIYLYQDNESLVQAYNKNEVDSISGISKSDLDNIDISEHKLNKTPLPRVFGVFFNQNESPVLLNKEVRQALNTSLDRNYITSEVFGELAMPESTPIPFSGSVSETNIDRARSILEDAGWELEDGVFNKKDERLSFSISTTNTDDLEKTAELVAKDWRELGADVSVKIFERNDLNQNVIRPRDFETLLFGQITGRNTELYSFWHSSQRVDPGLNISQYTNITVDKLVEDVRVVSDTTVRDDLASSFIQEVSNDIPAVFIYSPYFTYILPEKVEHEPFGNITLPSDRFNDIYSWYIYTQKVWKVFVD
ncbi:MAG: peptide ABC transporter substrate-binding protein [Candidatus Pacebacteria bacterium]|nr:peptide ABC transporter substrate-binding protein [Candidatus Paceibacterota bacterium]